MKSVYRSCVRAIAQGPFIDDAEFNTVMGCSRDELKSLEECWIEPFPADQIELILNALNNLLGYPHGKSLLVVEMVGFDESVIQSAYDLLLAEMKR